MHGPQMLMLSEPCPHSLGVLLHQLHPDVILKCIKHFRMKLVIALIDIGAAV